MKQMNSILIISYFEAVPKSGVSVRIFEMAKNLALLGNKVFLIAPGNDKDHVRFNNLRIINFTPKRYLKPLFIMYYLLKTGHQIIKKYKIDIIISAHLWSFLPSLILKKIYSKKLVLDEHNVEFVRAVRMKNFKHMIFSFMLEKGLANFSDSILTVSLFDKSALSNLGIPIEKINIIPNGADTQKLHPNINSSSIRREFNIESDPVVIFVGKLDYKPNLEALELLFHKIMPNVLHQIPNCKFLIVGMNPPAHLNHKSVLYTGYVTDVAEYIAAADIAIAPILSGSGTRLKILEYMAIGKPVISTSLGAEGIALENGKNMVLADDMNEFSNHIIQLITDADFRNKIGTKARELVVKKYDWNSIIKALDRDVLKSF
jgi:glycosyltransferase involved in cell wall biosynthesis